jgi:hypothetical protein
MTEWGKCEVERDGELLRAEVTPGALLELMDIRSEFPDAVVGLRVEEPALDVVYEHLLEEP